MERIKEAIKLAKAQPETRINVLTETNKQSSLNASDPRKAPAEATLTRAVPMHHVIPGVLESSRIIAHQADNPMATPFDILRTKITQEMHFRGWKVLIITSPTAACGKTVTAVNLALSMAKLPDRSVILMDLDLRKPAIARALGLHLPQDLAAYVNGEATIPDILFHIDIAGPRLTLVGNQTAITKSSEAIGSQQITALLKHLKSRPDQPLIIVDMPPLLASDDVLAFLPHADCCLITIAENVTTSREIEASKQLLAKANVIGCVLTKSNDKLDIYYN